MNRPRKDLRLLRPYKTRSIRPLALWSHNGWRVKVYGIAEEAEYPRPVLVESAKHVAARLLADDADMTNGYGVGFLGVHDAAGGCYVFFDWWADENELHHRPFVAPAARPAELRAVTRGSAACTWDLAVIAFERDAWVREVLARSAGPSIEGYLASSLSDHV